MAARKKTTKKKASKSKAVATRKPGGPLEVLDEMPDYMKGSQGKGMQGLGVDDMIMPRMLLLQGLSPAVVKGGQPIGEFYHNILEESFGVELLIVPVLAKKRAVLFQPRHMGEGVIYARAEDGITWVPGSGEWKVQPYAEIKKEVVWKLTNANVKASGLLEFGSGDPDDPDSKPAGTLFYDFICIAPERPEIGPFVVSLKKTQIGAAKTFVGKLNMLGAATYGGVFRMTSEPDSRGANDFFTYGFARAGFTPPEIFKECEALFEALKDKAYKIAGEEADEEGPHGPEDTSKGPVAY